jgi:hypothetical protein
MVDVGSEVSQIQFCEPRAAVGSMKGCPSYVPGGRIGELRTRGIPQAQDMKLAGGIGGKDLSRVTDGGMWMPVQPTTDVDKTPMGMRMTRHQSTRSSGANVLPGKLRRLQAILPRCQVKRERHERRQNGKETGRPRLEECHNALSDGHCCGCGCGLGGGGACDLMCSVQPDNKRLPVGTDSTEDIIICVFAHERH